MRVLPIRPYRAGLILGVPALLQLQQRLSYLNLPAVRSFTAACAFACSLSVDLSVYVLVQSVARRRL